jgi:hypothetical protein
LWDVFLQTHPEATVYHDLRWLNPVCAATGDRLCVYGFFVGGVLAGGVPVQVRTKGPASFARRAFATPYCPPLFAPHVTVAEQRALLAALAKRNTCTVLAASPFADPPRYGKEWQEERRATYTLDISDPESLWQSVPYPLRKKIRKARRNGLIFSQDCPPQVFFELYRKTFERRERGLPFNGKRFCRLLAELETNGIARRYLVATEEGRPCAAGLVVVDSHRAYYELAGTDVEATTLPASALLLWEIICDLAPTYSEFDLVGANLSGVNRFKKQFAGRLVPYSEFTAYRTLAEHAAFRIYRALVGRR